MSIFRKYYQKIVKPSVWARPNMLVTFRAELMPGKSREERTFKIVKVMDNGRVILADFKGEHRQSEFEPVISSK